MKTEMLHIRVGVEDAKRLKEDAARAGLKFSEYARLKLVAGGVGPVGRPVAEDRQPRVVKKIPAIVGEYKRPAPFSAEELAEDTYLDYSEGQ